MPVVTIQGSWYGSGCTVFSGVYANLGSRSHSNFAIVNIVTEQICGGYSFKVRDNTTGSIIYNSTSTAQSVALYFDNVQQQIKYDCVNGACIATSQYGTPGLYNSLAECQASCGGSTCTGKCLSSAEWAQIQGLALQIKNKSCS